MRNYYHEVSSVLYLEASKLMLLNLGLQILFIVLAISLSSSWDRTTNVVGGEPTFLSTVIATAITHNAWTRNSPFWYWSIFVNSNTQFLLINQ